MNCVERLVRYLRHIRRVWLEIVGQPDAAEKLTDGAIHSWVNIRILIAEDNKVNQEVVLRMLKLEDIDDVTVAKDGQEALEYVKECMLPASSDSRKGYRPFDLILMDVQMPGMDGLQSTMLIRESGYSARIVALTAFAEEGNIRDCMGSGMNYSLSKPIRRPQFRKVLKEYCALKPEGNEEKPASDDIGGSRSASSGTKTGVDNILDPSCANTNVPLSVALRPAEEQKGQSREHRRPGSPVSSFTTPR